MDGVAGVLTPLSLLRASNKTLTAASRTRFWPAQDRNPPPPQGGLLFMKVLEMTQHLNVVWNPGTREWFCTTCGRTSDHASTQEAQVELDEHECRIPSVEVSTTAPGTKTMRLMKKSYKTAPKPTSER